MADNTQLNTGAGGDVIATDELATLNGSAVSGVKAQRVKVGFGVDSDYNDVSANSGLPVTFDVNTSLPGGGNYLGFVGIYDYSTMGQTTAALSRSFCLATDQTSVTGTPATRFVAVQDYKDASRVRNLFFTASRVQATATDALISLTGFRTASQVAATTTPAIIVTGKNYRISAITISYISTATVGSAVVNLRVAQVGPVLITSPIMQSWEVGTTGATAGNVSTTHITFPDGLVVYVSAGIGVSIQGLDATGTPAVTGFVKFSMVGMEIT